MRDRAWMFLVVVALASAAASTQLEQAWAPVSLLTAIVLGFVVGVRWIGRRKLRHRFPGLTGDEFYAAFSASHVGGRDEVIRLRDELAGVFDIPSTHITPGQSLSDLTEASPLGTLDPALGDLFDDLAENDRTRDFSPRMSVGDYIELRLAPPK